MSASRGRVRRDRPHPPAPAPAAAGEGEHRRRGRAKPSPGPPGCRGAAASQSLSNGYLPRSDGEGRGGSIARGRVSPSDASVGLPRRGGFPTDTSPCQSAVGEGEQLVWWEPSPPEAPNCRGTAASRSIPAPVSPGGGRGACDSGEGQTLPQTLGLPRRGGFRPEPSPCRPSPWEGANMGSRNQGPPRLFGCCDAAALRRTPPLFGRTCMRDRGSASGRSLCRLPVPGTLDGVWLGDGVRAAGRPRPARRRVAFCPFLARVLAHGGG